MSDFLLDHIMWIFGLLAVLLLVALAAESQYKAQMMQQCMEDGRKEYECRALIKQGDTTYIPIIIPMR